MLRLLTLGGATIVNESQGDAPSAAATQRRTLALLSALAVAGPAGISRERLVALFWPDADAERGRHALAQTLYASRRSLGSEDLFDLGTGICLRADRMTSDVGDLERLLSRDPEAALGLYHGPFLDGFFLPGAVEFERWSATQRTRIENQVIRALHRLATDADDPRRALHWWKRAAALRPVDSAIAAALIQALANSGDRAGALKHADIYSALVREELELEPDSTIAKLVGALREPSRSVCHDVSASPFTAPVAAGSETVSPAPTGRRATVRLWRRARGKRPTAWISAVVATSVVVATSTTTWSHLRATDVHTLPLRQRVVVAPFRVAGADPSLSYLRDGIVDLLTARLSDGRHSIDAGTVLGAWRAAGFSPAMDVPRDTVVEVARRLRAEDVVVGGVVGAPSHIVIRATMLRVPTAAVVSRAIVEGPADSVASLVARLATRLRVGRAGARDSVR
jgi:DNA-binding SARP family transcriptional activator/TolB-like protein